MQDIVIQMSRQQPAAASRRHDCSPRRVRFENSRDLMRVVTDTAPHEAAAAQALQTAQASLREGLARTARRLAELGALRDGIDERDATDKLWFYLGNGAYFTLTADNGWPLDKAERWPYESVRTALLQPETQP